MDGHFLQFRVVAVREALAPIRILSPTPLDRIEPPTVSPYRFQSNSISDNIKLTTTSLPTTFFVLWYRHLHPTATHLGCTVYGETTVQTAGLSPVVHRVYCNATQMIQKRCSQYPRCTIEKLHKLLMQTIDGSISQILGGIGITGAQQSQQQSRRLHKANSGLLNSSETSSDMLTTLKIPNANGSGDRVQGDCVRRLIFLGEDNS